MKKVKEIVKKLLIIFVINLIIVCAAVTPFAENQSFAATIEEATSITNDVKVTESITKIQKKNATSDEIVDLDDLEFKNPGNPTNTSFSVEKPKAISFIFPLIGDFIDYILGIIFTFIKAFIVGVVEQLGKIIDDMLIKIEGKETEDIDYEDDNVVGDYIHYTIEDLIYNRIPALDVNLLSNTAGGEELEEDSPLYIIRTTVAGWYVTIRNLSIIMMLIMLIYTGIRMAISTVAAQRAEYKKQLYTWLKCFVMIFIIHYLIIMVLDLNNSLCKVFETDTKENTLYNTIKSRAYDVRLSVSFAGTIMYVALFIYWVRFLIIYIKRFIKNLVLILLAPLVMVRYALDNAGSKGKQGFNKWLNNFVLNVMIQSVHALTYSVIMGIAIELARTSLSGFVIALVFMQYLLKFDETVFQIFQFNGSSGDSNLHKMKKPVKDELAGIGKKVMVYGTFGKNMATGAMGVGKTAINAGSGAVKSAVKQVKKLDDQMYQKTGFSVGRAASSAKETVGNAAYDVGEKTHINDALRVSGAFVREAALESNPNLVALYDLNQNARRKGKQGEEARKTLKKYRKLQKKKYKARSGFITKNTAKIVSGALVLPMFAVDPKASLVMFAAGAKTPKDFKEMKKDLDKSEAKFDKEQDKIMNAIDKVNSQNKELDEMVNESSNLQIVIMQSFARMSTAGSREQAIAELEKIEKMNANSEDIKAVLNKKITNERISNIDSLVSESMNNIDKNHILTEQARERLAQIEKQTIMEEQERASKEKSMKDTHLHDYNKNASISYFNTETVANKFSEKIVENQVSEENIYLAKKINQMKNINQRSKAAGNGEIIDVNKFISNLRN